MLSKATINSARAKYSDFLSSLYHGNGQCKLTSKSEITPYGRCFYLFGMYLLQETDALMRSSDDFSLAIRRDLDLMRDIKKSEGVNIKYDKPYLQLLAFSLSAFSILHQLRDDPLDDHVLPLLSEDIESDLKNVGALEGIPRSGNQAMFMGILLCHARDYLGIDVDYQIDQWQVLHVNSMNEFGFWGTAKTMSHLQFQNGYHQYELFEYLHTPDIPWDVVAGNVASLADEEGHFAPYPGGGGCYDYDAIFLLTGAGLGAVQRHRNLLQQSAKTILSEQNLDGGFCESLYVRPRSFSNLLRSVKHVRSVKGIARKERLRQAVTLLRPKHNRIHTHWTRYSRHWNESDLWDSWFRMLAIAKIDVALDEKRISNWGFINYPGIGYHPLLRHIQD